MGICRYFQQGNCRFGAKCHNEHFDIKQIIKMDFDAAINGKQWPFSCYGPFKDKPSIANFIDDQSFEEIRYLCYESKKQNFFEQFHQRFNAEAIEATNKMKALLQFPGVIDLVAKIYDTPDANKVAESNNPFAVATSNINNNSNNSGNIFAKPTQTVTFGATTIFGQQPQQQQQQASTASIFGGGSNINANSTFGTSGSANLFGGQQQAQQTTSIFGGANATTATSSIFGGGQNQIQQQNLFNQQSNNNNVFGQHQQQQQQGFGQFSQVPQQTASIFSQQVGANNNFSQAANAASHILAQAQQQQSNNNSVFGQAPSVANNMFSQATQQQTNQGNSGFFASTAPQNQNMFFQAQQQQEQQCTANALNLSAVTQQQFPGQQQNMQNIDYSKYSRMEDLSSEDIEAFQAQEFTPGKLPFSPPPYEVMK